MISNSHTHRAQQAASVQQTASVRQAASAFLPEFIRAAALILAALTLCAFLAVRPAQAAEWMQPYLEQVQEWGVMRGDGKGNLNEDRTITRAEFVTLVNRAFGYTEAGENPFTDVNPNDWYAEDISIAHQAGYFNGTSANTASPLAPVTREQAAVLLGRCLRLQGETGVSASTFDDIEAVGGWSRGLIQEAADMGIIQGYADGTFRPSEPITRGQMACFLVRALGTLIQEPGDQSSGGVYGNLTINVPGVKLKDTTITGNLYLTGGVGLGNLELENVTVLGKIIVCGSGEAEHGEHSIILRNVTAGGLEVDSLMDQFLSIRAEGLTAIDNTIVRTSAYLEDLTEDGLGLKLIWLDGAEGARLQLAGNIKEVLNLTPSSTLQLAQGVAGVVTMDEKAVGASLTIDVDSVIKELNLDTATPVTGAGSITRLNVSTAGSNVSMLPDTIYVRPGINSTIANQTMDNKAANESSDEPRILAGYPAAKNIAPTSAEAVFRTNKAGTIRWALTALMDGSLGQEDLLNPGSNARILQSGTISATASNTDFTARLSGLTKEGSYYISALLEDARGHRSAVKVAAFTTPDDSVPAFATGYPETPECTVDQRTGEQVAQVKVMATKSCHLYYVLLPKNSTAPTAADFRAAAIPGSLGSGVITLQKNTPFLISRINTSHLAEKTEYDLYLWLNDADNGKSSAVRKITFTTKDITPPSILSLYDKSFTGTSVTMTFSLNEPGSIYWVVVKKDANFYASGIDKNNPGEAAKIQIMRGSGSSVISRGGPIQAAQGGTEYNFTVSGLSPQSYYDLYYVALDTAENYCVYSTPLIPPMEIHTEDTQNPSVTQDPPSGSSVSAESPITFTFDEVVYPTTDSTGQVREDPDFLGAYNAAKSGGAEAQRAFAELLMRHIVLYIENDDHSEQTAEEAGLVRNASNASTIGDNWVIDYRYATVTVNSDGTMVIFFPHGTAINLGSSITYHFVFRNVADGAGHMLEGTDSNGNSKQDDFTTDPPSVILADGDTTQIDGGAADDIRIDYSFTLTPSSTYSVPENVKWDMLLWTDTTMSYTLYSRSKPNGSSAWSEWQREGQITTNVAGQPGGEVYASLMNHPSLRNLNSTFPALNTLTDTIEFAIHVDSINSDTNYTAWNTTVHVRVEVLSGGNNALRQSGLQTLGNSTNFNNAISAGASAIGDPRPFSRPIPFTDSRAPEIQNTYPKVEAGDISATLQIMLDRPGTVYYVAAPIEKSGNSYTCPVEPLKLDDSKPLLSEIPEIETSSDNYVANHVGLEVKQPFVTTVTAGVQNSPGVVSDNSGDNPLQANILRSIQIPDLQPNTTYILYLVTQGVSPIYSENVLCYQFTTVDALLPKIDITRNGSTRATIQVDRSSYISYALVPTNSLTLANGSRFAEDFDDFANSGWRNTPYADVTNVNSVLDAMLTGCYDGRIYLGSLFDLYATEPAKNTFADLINQSASGAVTDVAMTARDQLITVQPNASSENLALPMSGMNGNDWYTLLVVGHTVNSSGNAFRASRSYYNNNPETLSVNNCFLSGQENSDDVNGNLTYSYTGTLTVSFSDSLHLRERNAATGGERRIPLDTCPLSSGTDTNHAASDNISTGGYLNLGSILTIGANGGGSSITINPNPAHERAVDTVTFTLSKIQSGSTILFPLNLCGASHNVRENTTLLITITRTAPPATEEVQNPPGTWSASITPTTWQS